MTLAGRGRRVTGNATQFRFVPCSLPALGAGHMSPSIAQTIGRVSADIETRKYAGEFCAIARLFMLSKGNRLEAAQIAEQRRFSSRVIETLRKSAVSPLSLTTTSDLAQFTGTTSAFLQSLSTAGAFDRMLPSMRQVPPRARVAATTLNATAYIHGEGAAKPVSSLQLAGHTLNETEAVAIIVQTQELLNALSPETGIFIRKELTNAVASVTDAEFIRLITANLTPLVSAGATSNQIMQDISRLLNALDVDAASK